MSNMYKGLILCLCFGVSVATFPDWRFNDPRFSRQFNQVPFDSFTGGQLGFQNGLNPFGQGNNGFLVGNGINSAFDPFQTGFINGNMGFANDPVFNNLNSLNHFGPFDRFSTMNRRRFVDPIFGHSYRYPYKKYHRK